MPFYFLIIIKLSQIERGVFSLKGKLIKNITTFGVSIKAEKNQISAAVLSFFQSEALLIFSFLDILFVKLILG